MSEQVPTPRLTVTSGRQGGATWRIPPGRTTVGRAPRRPLGAWIVLEDTSVSRRHAEVERTGDRVVLTDLGSRNGTWVNGQRLHGSRELRDGDVVKLAAVELRFAGPPEEPVTGASDLGAPPYADHLPLPAARPAPQPPPRPRSEGGVAPPYSDYLPPTAARPAPQPPSPPRSGGRAAAPGPPRGARAGRLRSAPPEAVPARALARTRVVYPSLDAPPGVVVGQVFELRVGISPVAVAGVAGEPFVLPGSDFVLGVQVIADGFRLAEGGSWRLRLPVTAADPHPEAVLRLVAEDPGMPVAARLVQASYTVGGSVVGFGARPVAVVRSAALLGTQPEPPPEPPARVTVTEGYPPADLTVMITLTDVEGKLLWAFESPYLDPPDPEPCRLGTGARRFAHTLIDQVRRREDGPDLYYELLGHARAVADKVPGAFFDTLARVAAAVAPRRPTVLIQSAEPYVPWELAALPVPLDPSVPPFLACQATVGRWVLASYRPKLPPPAHAEAATMTVVSGVYGEFDPRWERLRCAEEEARQLATMRAAASVDAKLPPVITLLSTQPVADILHFAVHGSADPAGIEDGLVLTDGKALSPSTVKGTDLPGEPFVFLNACQVGTGDAVLGDYGGMAAAFLYAGASAVVAPLWSVKDCVAKEFVLDFYRKVFAGAVPAEVIRELRCRVGGPGSTVPSALAYQFFGHPTMVLGDGS